MTLQIFIRHHMCRTDFQAQRSWNPIEVGVLGSSTTNIWMTLTPDSFSANCKGWTKCSLKVLSIFTNHLHFWLICPCQRTQTSDFQFSYQFVSPITVHMYTIKSYGCFFFPFSHFRTLFFRKQCVESVKNALNWQRLWVKPENSSWGSGSWADSCRCHRAPSARAA